MVEKEIDMAKFSKRLKETRVEKNFDTQQKLAKEVGISTQALSSYESFGKNKNKGKMPRLDTLFKLAYALGVSLDYLCGLCDSPSIADSPIRSEYDVARTILRLAEVVPCYAEIAERKLDDAEYDFYNDDVPDPDLHRKELPLVRLFIDDQKLADFVSVFLKLKDLSDNGNMDPDICNSLVDAKLNTLSGQKLRMHSNRSMGLSNTEWFKLEFLKESK